MGVVIAVGVVVGMIAAGRIDKLMAPAPRPRPDDDAPTSQATSIEEEQL